MIPKYIRVKDSINSDITNNKYPIGSNLPTEIELAKIYDVSRSTIRQALELLCEQGIISKHWGSGNVVRAKKENTKDKTVMILLPDTKSSESQRFISDITSTLAKNGYQLEVHETGNSFQRERQLLLSLLNDVYGGLIISIAHSNTPSPNADLLQLLLKRLLPIIFVRNAPANIYNPCVVRYDSYDKGYQMARSLINAGNKKLGGIFINDDASSLLSFSGFIDAIRDANLEIVDNCFLFCNSSDPVGINSRSTTTINRFLKKAYDSVSAVYIDDDRLSSEGMYPLYNCALTPSKSIGKECANAIVAIKKNGNFKPITIPYKN